MVESIMFGTRVSARFCRQGWHVLPHPLLGTTVGSVGVIWALLGVYIGGMQALHLGCMRQWEYLNPKP